MRLTDPSSRRVWSVLQHAPVLDLLLFHESLPSKTTVGALPTLTSIMPCSFPRGLVAGAERDLRAQVRGASG